MLISRVLRIRRIDSLDLPELAPYLTLRQRGDHLQERLFVAEGAKVVERLLASELELVSALLTPEHLEPLQARFEARPEPIEAYVGPKPLLEHLTGFSLYEGLLVCARIPAPAELDVVCALLARPRFLVAVDGLANAENLGGDIGNPARVRRPGGGADVGRHRLPQRRGGLGPVLPRGVETTSMGIEWYRRQTLTRLGLRPRRPG